MIIIKKIKLFFWKEMMLYKNKKNEKNFLKLKFFREFILQMMRIIIFSFAIHLHLHLRVPHVGSTNLPDRMNQRRGQPAAKWDPPQTYIVAGRVKLWSGSIIKTPRYVTGFKFWGRAHPNRILSNYCADPSHHSDSEADEHINGHQKSGLSDSTKSCKNPRHDLNLVNMVGINQVAKN